jgi:hypothetical protein
MLNIIFYFSAFLTLLIILKAQAPGTPAGAAQGRGATPAAQAAAQNAKAKPKDTGMLLKYRL